MNADPRNDPRARAAMGHIVKWHMVDRDAVLNGLPALMAALDAADPLRAPLTGAAVQAGWAAWAETSRVGITHASIRAAMEAALAVQAGATILNAPPPIYTDSAADQVLKRLQAIEGRLADIERGAAP